MSPDKGGRDSNSPVEFLSAFSNLQLPRKSGKSTSCCGGPDELLYGDIAEKVSEDRFKQLEVVGAQKIVTACPVCFENLNKGKEVIELPDFLASIALGK